MWQALVVGLIVLVATVYAVWALMPAGLRRRAAARVAGQARRLGASGEGAARLQEKLASASSCNECSSCKGCSASPQQPGATAVVAPPPSLCNTAG